MDGLVKPTLKLNNDDAWFIMDRSKNQQTFLLTLWSILLLQCEMLSNKNVIN